MAIANSLIRDKRITTMSKNDLRRLADAELLIINILIMVIVALTVSSCKPQQLITASSHIEDKAKIRTDSIYVHDSIYIHEYTRGDTCYLTEYRDRWRERVVQVHDTTTIDNSHTETITLKERFIPP